MEEKVGKVKSVRITRSGLVIVECKDRDQAKKAMKIRSFNKCRVEVFFLGGKRRKMGVISGVPLTVKPQQLMDVEGEKEKAECIHCGGDHYAGSAQCPRTIKEVKVNRMRTERRVSYAEAVKRVEGQKESGVDEKREPEERGNVHGSNICMEKTRFLAFIAMVINCAVEIQRKSERIKMVLAAAKRFLNVVDVTGEDLDSVLREEYTEAQT